MLRAVVIGTRKHTNCFSYRKCTVAAAYNLSVHMIQRILYHGVWADQRLLCYKLFVTQLTTQLCSN